MRTRRRPTIVLVELGLVEQRYAAVLEVLNDRVSVSEVAARSGVSRQTVHRWLRRYAAGGLAALVDQSTVPAACPHQMAPGIEARIVELRRQHPAGAHEPSAIAWNGRATPSSPAAARSIAVWSATASSNPRPGGANGPTTSAGSGPGRWSCGRWTSSVASCSPTAGRHRSCRASTTTPGSASRPAWCAEPRPARSATP